MSIKVKGVVPLDDMKLLVIFENNVIKKFDVKSIIPDYPEYESLHDSDLFNLVTVEPGGYGVSWNSELDCSEGELWENGVEIPLTLNDLASFTRYGTLATPEVVEMLKCSRQNVDDLIKRGKLHPVKTYTNGKLFLKTEIDARTN